MSDWEEDWDRDETVSNGDVNYQKSSTTQRQQNDFSVNNSHEDRSNKERRNYNGGRSRKGDGGERGNQQRRDQRRNNEFEESMDIRAEDIGRIIGRGGSNIQKIQNDFNVHLDVDKRNNCVKISGNTQHDVDDALLSVKDQIERGGDNNRSRGSGGGGYGGERRNRDNFGDSSGRYGGGGGGRYGRNENGGDYGGSYGQKRETHSSNYDNKDKYARKDDNDFYNQTSTNSNTFDALENGVIDWNALNQRAETERNKRWAKCPPLTKNFYQEASEVTNMLAEEAERIRHENNNITVSRVFKTEDGKDDRIPNPIWKFEQCFAAYPDLLAELDKQQFVKPSPIQSQAWPILLQGDDLIGIAQTGTGKTLAFLLPAMIHTEYQSVPRSERGGPNVLVLAPTRELAIQIEKEVNKYSFRGMRAVCVYGGGNRREQISEVERGVEIIICTPGRLNDLIQANVINVATITYLVLDEADRMLDMGFEPQIRKVLLDIRPDRQTVMTSATWPPGVRRLAQSYMSNPIQVCVGSLDLAATHTVRQVVEILEDDQKYYAVRNFLKNMEKDDKCIIFCGRKVRADDLSSDLAIEGFITQCIHGSRDQSDREQAIADISSGDVKILIATDVASRGLDIEDITYVINFDFPHNIEEYVHRVGRTGRAGRTGTSISYITRTDWGMAKELIDILEEANQEVAQELREMAQRFQSMKDRRANEMSKFNGFRGGSSGRNRRDRY